MTGRGGGRRGQGTKPKVPIFPIGPRRRRVVRPSFSQRLVGRLTSNGTIALLIGTMIGAVGGDLAHDWLHPDRVKPVVVADAPAATPVAIATNPATPQSVPATTELSPAGGSSTEVAMAAPTVAEPVAIESTEKPIVSNAPAGADREDLGSVIASLTAQDTVAPEEVAPAAGAESAAPIVPATAEPPIAGAPDVEIPAVAIPMPSGTPSWLAFAMPAPEPAGRALIAIVIDDVGLDRRNAQRAIELPGPITLSFMTYAENLPQQAAEARRLGHELMLHVPMEPLDGGVNAGPDMLGVDLRPEEIRRRLNWGLDRMTGYVGINNHMGSRFTRSIAGMAVVMQELRRRGLMFLDSKTIDDSVGDRVATEYGVPHVDRDIFLDNDMDSGAVDQMLVELERVARERGYAIGIGHPHPGTLDALMRWLPTLEARGFELVPISTIVRRVTPPTG